MRRVTPVLSPGRDVRPARTNLKAILFWFVTV